MGNHGARREFEFTWLIKRHFTKIETTLENVKPTFSILNINIP